MLDAPRTALLLTGDRLGPSCSKWIYYWRLFTYTLILLATSCTCPAGSSSPATALRIVWLEARGDISELKDGVRRDTGGPQRDVSSSILSTSFLSRDQLTSSRIYRKVNQYFTLVSISLLIQPNHPLFVADKLCSDCDIRLLSDFRGGSGAVLDGRSAELGIGAVLSQSLSGLAGTYSHYA